MQLHTENHQLSSAAYEQLVACTLYTRLVALRSAKTAELLSDGMAFAKANSLAEHYVITRYCDGHPCSVYAVAQARLTLLREGYIPTNATTMPNPWKYDPYTRLYPDYAESVIGCNA